MNVVGTWLNIELGLKLTLAFITVAFTEFIYLTSSIDDLLFASEEWVALRAHINTHRIITISRTCNEGISAATGYVNFLVIWMYVCFHDLIIRYEFLSRARGSYATINSNSSAS